MGKLVVTEFVSVDGVFEDPGGSEDYEHGGWTFEYDRGDAGNQFKLDELMEAEVQLLGRVTYEGFAAAWPSREGEFAEKLNNDPKYVVSTTLKDPEWQNTTVISGDVAEEIAMLKGKTNGVILVAGSGALMGTLLGADLVDELRLMVFPTVLGRGKRLFPDGIDRLKLKLAETKTVGPDGVQIQIYPGPTGSNPIRKRRSQSDQRASYLARDSWMPARCMSVHSTRRRRTSCRLRPRSVSAYSTCGGTVGKTVRETSPSRSSRRRVTLSIRCVMPSVRRRSSLKRRGSSSRRQMTMTDHLSPIRSSTSRTGAAS
jgi:dihydrofolate reductase